MLPAHNRLVTPHRSRDCTRKSLICTGGYSATLVFESEPGDDDCAVLEGQRGNLLYQMMRCDKSWQTGFCCRSRPSILAWGVESHWGVRSVARLSENRPSSFQAIRCRPRRNVPRTGQQ